MKTIIIAIAVLLFASVVHAEDYSWQVWVNRKTAEINFQKSEEQKHTCAVITYDLQRTLADLEGSWTCCNKRIELIDKAQTLIRQYRGEACYNAFKYGLDIDAILKLNSDLYKFREYSESCVTQGAQ